MTYVYPPLPSGDSLRVLTLDPGSFTKGLSGTLTPVSFASRPRYIALSYTWGDPSPEQTLLPVANLAVLQDDSKSPQLDALGPDAKTGVIMLRTGPQSSDQSQDDDPHAPSWTRVEISHNLALALLYLRSHTHELRIWVDALCINQADIHERNAQVSLMAFVYRRASLVVAWLGMPPIAAPTARANGAVRAMSDRWESGETESLAGFLATSSAGGGGRNGVSTGRHRASGPASRGDNAQDSEGEEGAEEYGLRLTSSVRPEVKQNAYWTRLWVVQEVCLAREMLFAYGAMLWNEKQILALNPSTVVPPTKALNARSMKALLRTRQQRYSSDAMKLENLLDRFRRQGCAELRDRVYGLLGLCCDMDAAAADASSPLDDEDSDDSDGTPNHRGKATLRVDYSATFFEIWRDAVVGTHLRRLRDPFFMNGRPSRIQDSFTRLVRTASLAQAAFEGRIEAEIENSHSIPPREAPPVPVIGYVAGKILHLGPTYSVYTGSFQEYQTWVAEWEARCTKPGDMERLRELEDAYDARITAFDKADLARIAEFTNDACMGFIPQKMPWVEDERVDDESLLLPSLFQSIDTWRARKALGGSVSHGNYGPDDVDRTMEAGMKNGEPVRFLGTNFCSGLAPRQARKGDLVVRFIGCNAAVVVRSTNGGSEESLPFCPVIGRADVAVEKNQGRAEAEDTVEMRELMLFLTDSRTLQKMTAGVETYPLW